MTAHSLASYSPLLQEPVPDEPTVAARSLVQCVWTEKSKLRRPEFLLLFDHYGFKSFQGQNLVDQTVAVSNSTIFGEHTKCMNFKIIIRNVCLVFLLSKTFFVCMWIWIGIYAENKTNNINNNYNKHMHPKVI